MSSSETYEVDVDLREFYRFQIEADDIVQAHQKVTRLGLGVIKNHEQTADPEIEIVSITKA